MTYPRIEACLSPIVALVIGPLVELLPERLGLPRPELGLELRVELMEIGRLDLEQVAEMPEVAEDGLEGGGVAELVEHLVGQRHVGRGHLLSALLQVVHTGRRRVILLLRRLGELLQLRLDRVRGLQSVSLPATERQCFFLRKKKYMIA